MDIRFDDEQRLLSDSVAKMLQSNYGFDARQEIVKSDRGWNREVWKSFADLGLLSAPFSEGVGGYGGGPMAVYIVMRALGQHLVVEPYFETVVVVGGLLEALGSASQKEVWLAQIMSGQAIMVPAFFESRSRYALTHVTVRAERNAGGYVLRGTKAAAIAAPWADLLLISARTSGTSTDPQGISVFVVDRRSPGVHAKDFQTIDGRRAAELELDNVQVAAADLLGEEGSALAALELCRDQAIAALCAEATGAMEVLLNDTVAYAKARHQFGVPLGSFQALQHRMSDMFIALEEATAITNAVTWSLTSGSDPTGKLAAAAKVKVGEAARFVGEQAVQIHGGMGMSDELRIGHYLKRLLAINVQFGDVAFHTGRFTRLAAHADRPTHEATSRRPLSADLASKGARS